MTETPDLFVPPAADGLPPGTLDSATQGADRLDASARTPYGRNLLAHALVQLARDGWLRPAPAAAPSAPADRAAILREAADTVDAMNEGCSRRQPCGACNAREDAADSLRRLAGEAQQPETQARLAAYQTCGVCKSGYPTGGSCGTCAFNARMAAGARQADTAGEQQ
jgi:hypothetical protein